MKITFVITFGTSDVQFESKDIEKSGFELHTSNDNGFESFSLASRKNPNFSLKLKRNRNHDSFLLASPRIDGTTVLDNFKALSVIISLPLTLPAITKLINEGNQIKNFILVFTDQHDANEKYRSNDSVHIAEIFKQKIQLLFPVFTEESFISVCVNEKVTDIDHQYITLSEKCRTILQSLKEQAEKIILLAQGGIDQINQALTLQLIQAFGDRLIIYQQAEDKEPCALSFTKLFLQDFIKQQAIALINAADYHGALMMIEMVESDGFKKIEPLIRFAGFRKLFLYKEAEKVVCNRKHKPGFISDYCTKKPLSKNLTKEFSNPELLFLIAERFYIADFYFEQKKLTDYVLALQIFFETFCNLYLNDVYQIDLSRKYHESFSQLLDNIRQNETDIYNVVQMKLQTSAYGLIVSFPTLAALSIAKAEKFPHPTVQKILQPLVHINSQLNGFSGSCGIDVLRNKIAHGGQGVLENDLYLASSTRFKGDKLKYWHVMMAELREVFIINKNPYNEMNEFLVERLSILY